MLQAFPSTVNVNGIGALYAQTLTASETAYTQPIHEGDTCSGIATISPGAGNGPTLSETVTGVAAGTCTVTFTDNFSQTVSASVVVTTGGIVIQSRNHRH